MRLMRPPERPHKWCRLLPRKKCEIQSSLGSQAADEGECGLNVCTDSLCGLDIFMQENGSLDFGGKPDPIRNPLNYKWWVSVFLSRVALCCLVSRSVSLPPLPPNFKTLNLWSRLAIRLWASFAISLLISKLIYEASGKFGFFQLWASISLLTSIVLLWGSIGKFLYINFNWQIQLWASISISLFLSAATGKLEFFSVFSHCRLINIKASFLKILLNSY